MEDLINYLMNNAFIMRRSVCLIIYFCLFLNLRAGIPPEVSKPLSISGHITDGTSGEVLIAANVYIRENGSGTVTNPYGFYSLPLPPGNYTLGVSYVGYNTFETRINLSGNITLDIELMPEARQLEEIVISSVRKNNNVSSLQMGATQLPIQSIRKIPAFMGEVDVIKAIQLLPGVSATSEGSTGFSVRGGASDQNLILLDEATVYNASHLMGFFSVFNNDAVKDAKLYKGDIPASSGGRLSSLLEVRMKEGNSKTIAGTGGIGTISSRFTLEGPILKEKTSFLLAGRRTYADVFLPLAKNKDIRDNSLYFYDLNAKLNHIINENNRIFISGYLGRDVFKNQFAGIDFGNNTFTLRWNHLFSKRVFSNLSLIRSNYDYKLGTPEGRPDAFEWTSNMEDHTIKADLIFYISPENTLKFGSLSTYHHFKPGMARGMGSESIFTEFSLPDAYSLEHGFYVMNESKLGENLSVKYGLRFSGFQNIGKATVYNFDENYQKIDSTVYSRGDFYNSYWGAEPRAGLTWLFNENSSVKASYSRTRQYLQLAQNSTAGTPLDIWFSAGQNIKPQVSDQFSLGLFRNFLDHSLEGSVEGYYKKMSNTIDFRDHAALLLNPELEGEVRTGDSWSAGLEFLLNIDLKKLNGWIGYTLSKTERRIETINFGKAYAAPYDKPHNITIVLNFPLGKRFNIGANWIYSTGNPVTFPTGRFELMGSVLPVYSDRNAYRMPDYHRLDLAITYAKPPKSDRKWRSEWNLSVYNAYARHNAWSINFVQDEIDPNVTRAELTYLFSVIPALTYNFNF